MEDATFAVFHFEPDQLFYKQILTTDEATELNQTLLTNQNWRDGAVVIANGIRPYLDLELTPDLKERLETVLADYFPDLQIAPHVRFYNHQLGGVKPHVDVPRDGRSAYTLLLYLSSDFEGGRLSVKLKRSPEEKKLSEPTMHHKVFTFTPRLGYGVVFKKSLLHWADDVVEGAKNFLLVDINSQF